MKHRSPLVVMALSVLAGAGASQASDQDFGSLDVTGAASGGLGSKIAFTRLAEGP